MTDNSSTREGFFRGMDPDDRFWLSLWGLAAATLAVFITAIAVYQAQELRTIQQMVADGVNPLEARCAVAGSGSNTICAVVAAKGGLK